MTNRVLVVMRISNSTFHSICQAEPLLFMETDVKHEKLSIFVAEEFCVFLVVLYRVVFSVSPKNHKL